MKSLCMLPILGAEGCRGRKQGFVQMRRWEITVGYIFWTTFLGEMKRSLSARPHLIKMKAK